MAEEYHFVCIKQIILDVVRLIVGAKRFVEIRVAVYQVAFIFYT